MLSALLVDYDTVERERDSKSHRTQGFSSQQGGILHSNLVNQEKQKPFVTSFLDSRTWNDCLLEEVYLWVAKAF